MPPGNLSDEDTDGAALVTLQGHQDPVTCIAVLSDGRIVSGSKDRTLRVWDADTGAALATLYGHQDGIRFVVFCPG